MATHGHRGLADVLHGSVASELRHISMLPVLMVRGNPTVVHPPAGPRVAS
jgi:nucleotide-binding universal stress UspA family protein